MIFHRLFFLLLCHLVFFSFGVAQRATKGKPGKLFIIGGGTRPATLINRMIDEAGLRTSGYAIILPMASAEVDSAIYYNSKQLRDNGVSHVVGIKVSPNRAVRPSQLDSLEKAALIYIPGGDQNLFMQAITGSNVAKAIRTSFQNGNMVAGTSAGAAVMSQLMITGIEKKYTAPDKFGDHPEYSSIEADNIELKPGLGLLTKCIIDQHFIYRKRLNRLVSVAMENPNLFCVGINESTALLIKNKTAEVIGNSQVITLLNLDKTHRNKEGLLGNKHIKMSVYLPGQTFKLPD